MEQNWIKSHSLTVNLSPLWWCLVFCTETPSVQENCLLYGSMLFSVGKSLARFVQRYGITSLFGFRLWFMEVSCVYLRKWSRVAYMPENLKYLSTGKLFPHFRTILAAYNADVDICRHVRPMKCLPYGVIHTSFSKTSSQHWIGSEFIDFLMRWGWYHFLNSNVYWSHWENYLICAGWKGFSRFLNHRSCLFGEPV